MLFDPFLLLRKIACDPITTDKQADDKQFYKLPYGLD